ncbi:hypothetical protein Bbelb_187250 [Branchiostoma belcheri]|nr:hypothetical protein Bbelb_187250 [Branchiostoma belcheri]
MAPKPSTIATLKTVIDRDCLDILRNIDIEADPGQTDAAPRKDPDKIIEALDKHFKPLKNTVYERYKFNTCEQAQGESIEVYVERMSKLVSTCDYGALKDEMLRDQIVLGVRDNKVAMRLLKQKNLTLQLQAALEECKASETTNKQLKAMQSNGSETVHYAKTRPRRSQDENCLRASLDRYNVVHSSGKNFNKAVEMTPWKPWKGKTNFVGKSNIDKYFDCFPEAGKGHPAFADKEIPGEVTIDTRIFNIAID